MRMVTGSSKRHDRICFPSDSMASGPSVILARPGKLRSHDLIRCWNASGGVAGVGLAVSGVGFVRCPPNATRRTHRPHRHFTKPPPVIPTPCEHWHEDATTVSMTHVEPTQVAGPLSSSSASSLAQRRISSYPSVIKKDQRDVNDKSLAVSLEELSQFLIALGPLRECFALLLLDPVPVVPLSRVPDPCRFLILTDAIPRRPCPFSAWPPRGYRRQPHPWAFGDARRRSCHLMSRTRRV